MMTRKARPLPDPRKPETVQRGSRLPYNVAYVGGIQAAHLVLTQRELLDLQRAFRGKLSNAIRHAYAVGLSSYVFAVGEMDKVTPKKVHARLKRVEERGKGLREAVDRLEITDASHIDSFFTHSFLRNRPTISVNEFLRAINLFLANVQGAVQDLDTMQRKGAMPAYPAKALSLTIAHGLFLENNKFPPLTRGGVFDRVLKCALDAGASRTSRYRSRAVGRMDVMSLMRGAKDGFDPQEALAFGKVLSSFPT